ncbi:TPA: hypothetical protein ACH3X3_002743 [Trebouxia sp. C0006]
MSIQDLYSSRLFSIHALQVSSAPPLTFVISGPSGVGKDAVIKQLQQTRPELHFVVTATSRAMRPKEVDGVDYIFVTKEKFESWIKADELLEHALVYGEYKGILRSQIVHALANKQDVILRLDVQGAATMRRLMPDAVSIFLVATSQHELVHRLLERKTEPLDKLVLRVQTANDEVAHLKDFDYVVTNGQGQLDQCVRQIDAIIEAEKCQRWRLVS